jgi:lipoprotein signal peptidase
VPAVAGAVALLDQLAKALAIRLLPASGLVYNTGAAFGFLSGHAWALAAAGLAAIPLLLGMDRLWQFGQAGRWGLALALGGAVGNTLDRLLSGRVVDFITVPGYPFQFNLADVAIRLGAMLLLFDIIRHAKSEQAAGRAKLQTVRSGSP